MFIWEMITYNKYLKNAFNLFSLLQRVYILQALCLLTQKTEVGEWIPITFSNTFEAYNTVSGNVYRKIGNFVEIKGQVKPKSAITKNATTEIFKLPEGYYPEQSIIVVMQGSGINKWNLSINTDGSVTCSRYGANEIIDIPTGTWMPFYVCYGV